MHAITKFKFKLEGLKLDKVYSSVHNLDLHLVLDSLDISGTGHHH